MADLKEYGDMLKDLGTGYFIEKIQYVTSLADWVDQKGESLSEPHQPMKLVSLNENSLAMVVQSEVTESILDDVLKAMDVRLALKSTTEDPAGKLDSLKKKIAFCFFKEYARTVRNVGGDEILEDEWAFEQMGRLGFFEE